MKRVLMFCAKHYILTTLIIVYLLFELWCFTHLSLNEAALSLLVPLLPVIELALCWLASD